MIKLLVFDFDGVVVRRSEFFKRAAWPRVFMIQGFDDAYIPYFQKAEAKYGNGKGGDRYDIMRAIDHGLGKSGKDCELYVEEGARIFDAHVQRAIAEAGIDPADRAAFAKLADRFTLYLNSATPIASLNHSAEALLISQYLTGILGRPNSKIENFREIAAQEKVLPQEILFVGDNMSDYKAAQEFDC